MELRVEAGAMSSSSSRAHSAASRACHEEMISLCSHDTDIAQRRQPRLLGQHKVLRTPDSPQQPSALCCALGADSSSLAALPTPLAGGALAIQ